MGNYARRVGGPGVASASARACACVCGIVSRLALALTCEARGGEAAGVTIGANEDDEAASSVEGSCGGGPSIAQRLVSYLLLMKLSTLCSGGACPTLRCASQ